MVDNQKMNSFLTLYRNSLSVHQEQTIRFISIYRYFLIFKAMQIKVVYPDVDYMFSDNVSADDESEKNCI